MVVSEVPQELRPVSQKYQRWVTVLAPWPGSGSSMDTAMLPHAGGWGTVGRLQRRSLLPPFPSPAAFMDLLMAVGSLTLQNKPRCNLRV